MIYEAEMGDSLVEAAMKAVAAGCEKMVLNDTLFVIRLKIDQCKRLVDVEKNRGRGDEDAIRRAESMPGNDNVC